MKKNTIGRMVARIFALSLILQSCTSIQKKEFAASVRITNENYDEAFEKLNAKINSYYTALIDENQGE